MLHARVLRAMESQYRENSQDVIESPRASCVTRGALEGSRNVSVPGRGQGGRIVGLPGRRGFLRIGTAGAYAPAAGSRTYPPGNRRPIEVAADFRSDCELQPARAASRRGGGPSDFDRRSPAAGGNQRRNGRLSTIGAASLMPALNAACARSIARDIGDMPSMSARPSMWPRPICGAATFSNRSPCSRITSPGSMARCGICGLAPTGTGSVLWLGMLGASHGRLGNFEAAIDAARKACLIADEVRAAFRHCFGLLVGGLHLVA